MPPTDPSASKTWPRRPRRARTQADVSPAGPAPRIADPRLFWSLPSAPRKATESSQGVGWSHPPWPPGQSHLIGNDQAHGAHPLGRTRGWPRPPVPGRGAGTHGRLGSPARAQRRRGRGGRSRARCATPPSGRLDDGDRALGRSNRGASRAPARRARCDRPRLRSRAVGSRRRLLDGARADHGRRRLGVHEPSAGLVPASLPAGQGPAPALLPRARHRVRHLGQLPGGGARAKRRGPADDARGLGGLGAPRAGGISRAGARGADRPAGRADRRVAARPAGRRGLVRLRVHRRRAPGRGDPGGVRRRAADAGPGGGRRHRRRQLEAGAPGVRPARRPRAGRRSRSRSGVSA